MEKRLQRLSMGLILPQKLKKNSFKCSLFSGGI